MRRIAPFFLDMGQKQALAWTMIGIKKRKAPESQAETFTI